MSITERQADLSQYPLILQNPSATHVSMGDLHGNTMKLLYILIEEGVMKMPPEDYRSLFQIYSKPMGTLTGFDLSNFEKIVQRAEIIPGKNITLVGDELADRGNNDFFTLSVFKKMSASELNFDILVSNHSLEFLRFYEYKAASPFTNRILPITSLDGLIKTINDGCIAKPSIDDMVLEHYLPRLKAISYTISPETHDVTLFTHAPIGLETIEQLAIRYDIVYQDRTRDDLINTIDKINAAFLTELRDGRFVEKFYGQMDGLRDAHSKLPFSYPIDSPFYRLVWTRELDKHTKTNPSGDYQVRFVHGHVGSTDNPKEHEAVYKNIPKTQTHLYENLDTFFGHTVPRDNVTGAEVKHCTRASNELPPTSTQRILQGLGQAAAIAPNIPESTRIEAQYPTTLLYALDEDRETGFKHTRDDDSEEELYYPSKAATIGCI